MSRTGIISLQICSCSPQGMSLKGVWLEGVAWVWLEGVASLVLYLFSEEHGICFVETSNLDGETNLKIRQAHPSTAELNESNVVSSVVSSCVVL